MNKPDAIFICGPIAAGKSHTQKYFKEMGYDQGVILNYDDLFLKQYNALKTENPALNDKILRDTADHCAMANRELIYQACLKNKLTFSYENCMNEKAIHKMQEAKDAGFNVKVYVTFQKSLEGHIAVEQLRRKRGELGAHFINDKDARNGIKGTYENCLKNIKHASEIANNFKLYINYMDSDPEKNKPRLAVEMKNNVLIQRSVESNKDVEKRLNEILPKNKEQAQSLKTSIQKTNSYDKPKFASIGM